MARDFTPLTFQDMKPGEAPGPCRGCGRKVEPFELIRVDAVDNAAVPGTYRCTSCVNEARRSGGISREALIKALQETRSKHPQTGDKK